MLCGLFSDLIFGMNYFANKRAICGFPKSENDANPGR